MAAVRLEPGQPAGATLAAARPALPATGSRPDTLSTAFTRNIAGLAREEIPEANIAIAGPLQLAVRTDDRDFTWYLDNLWREVQQAPAAQGELSRQHLSTLRAMMAHPSLTELQRDPSTVVPVMKSREDVTRLNELMESAGGVISEQLAEDLFIVYANDTEHTLAYLSRNELAALGIPRERLRQIAARNLERLLPAAEKESRGELHRIVAGGNFEASILLIDAAWESERRQVEGELIAAVPTRDVILYTGSRNPEALRNMRDAVDQLYSAGTYSISPHLYRRENGDWVKLP